MSSSGDGSSYTTGSSQGGIPDNSTVDSINATSEAKPRTEPGAALTVGWREWVSLPQMGIPAIKAKIDTGARTSAIHAFEIERVKRDGGQDWLTFSVQPLQKNASIVVRCEAPLVDIRRVTDSGGHAADRYFIRTLLKIGDEERDIEITLSQRDDMLFRMLLGRTSMVPGIQVNPSQSFSLGRVSARDLYVVNANGKNS